MVVAMLLSGEATAQKIVSFPTEDGGVVYANAFGKSDKAVVLAHGGQFNKESWDKQAHALVAVGFEVLALDFRGYGKSKGPGDSDPISAPLYVDVLSAVVFCEREARRPCRLWEPAWEDGLLETHQLLRDRVR
jgi:pimeloyl-ACP methyl ester carboxylesterase